MENLWVWTKDQQIICPDRKFEKLPPNHSVQALRGYAHVLAVFQEDTCMGWMMKENLPINPT